MSDKKNISIEDRGWEAMHSILDKEMPQKKKRRILPWFFLGTIFIVGLMLFGSKLYKSPKDQTNTAISLNENTTETIEIKDELELIDDIDSKVPTNNANPVFIKNNGTSSKITNNDVTNEQEIDKNQVEVSKQIVNTQISSQENNLKSFSSDENIDIENNALENKVFEKDTKLIDQKAIENNLDPKSEIKVFKSDLPDKSIQKVTPLKRKGPQSNVQPLFLEIPFIIEFMPERLNKTVKPIAAVEKANLLSPYVFGLGNYQSNINGVGYGLGAGLNYQINTLGIYFDASYSRSNYEIGEVPTNFSSSGSTKELDNNPINEDLEGANVAEGENLKFENFSNLTSGISELKLNLGLRKSLSKRVGIDFGLAYSKLLKVNNKSISVDLDDAATFNQISTINVSSTELFTTGAYGKYDIIPHIGLEYNFFPGAYFGLSYNHGLKNLIANTNVERYNSLSQDESIFRRNIEAKLRYQF